MCDLDFDHYLQHPAPPSASATFGDFGAERNHPIHFGIAGGPPDLKAKYLMTSAADITDGEARDRGGSDVYVGLSGL